MGKIETSYISAVLFWPLHCIQFSEFSISVDLKFPGKLYGHWQHVSCLENIDLISLTTAGGLCMDTLQSHSSEASESLCYNFLLSDNMSVMHVKLCSLLVNAVIKSMMRNSYETQTASPNGLLCRILKHCNEHHQSKYIDTVNVSVCLCTYVWICPLFVWSSTQ